MSAQSRAARALLGAASLLVPRARRADWRREWTAELAHVQARGGPVARMALGALADALEVGLGPRAFADAARFGWATLARSPLHVAGAAAVLAAGMAVASLCLALAARTGTRLRADAGLGALLAFAFPLVLALVASAAAAAASLIRRAVAAQRHAAPCSPAEARAAAALLCAGAGLAALLAAAAATGRFPAAVRPGGAPLLAVGSVLGPVVLAGAIACAAVRRWTSAQVDRP